MSNRRGYARLFAGLVTLAVLSVPALAAAQVQDTLGVVDTLRFGVVAAAAGDRVAVPVNVTNDMPILGLSIPVAYPAAVLHADSVSFAHGRISHFAQLSENIDQARGVLLIGAVQFTEAPLAAGSGAVAWVHFTVAGDAAAGAVAAVDTGYFSDPGMLLFSVDVSGGVSVLPAVAPGRVTVLEPNTPPEFVKIPSQIVREGDSLRLSLSAHDHQGDPIRMSMPNKPTGAVFSDFGNGTASLRWVVPYSGPYAAGGGVSALRFAADDGRDVAVLDVGLDVVNVNRPPEIEVADTIRVPAFDSLHLDIAAHDPDLEPVSLDVGGLPPAVELDAGNPASIRWRPLQADTGMYPVTVSATDGHGGVTDQRVMLLVEPVPRVEFGIGTVSGYSDQDVILPITMKNTEVISGFELLFELDPTAAAVLGLEIAGTRIENWEMFATSLNHNGNPGDVQIVARADVADGTPTPSLAPGDGLIVKVKLHLIKDAAYAGLTFPVRFVFRTANANTAIDVSNALIKQDQISYTHGSVSIVRYENVLPGDLNLNGLPFEIADVVILANHISDPTRYPLSFEQLANADANQDGLAATISDLVFMILKLTGGVVFRGAPSAGQMVCWSLSPSGSLALQSQTPLGGALVEYRIGGAEMPSTGLAAAKMNFVSSRDGDRIRVVIYSPRGELIDPDAGALIEGMDGAEVTELQLSDAAGQDVQAYRGVMPERPVLLGNFPNPFNPSTAIRFALANPGDVQIAIFNTLGRRVKVLGGWFDAGEHEVIWHGDDEQGLMVGSGVYFYRFESGERHEVRRMLLLK